MKLYKRKRRIARNVPRFRNTRRTRYKHRIRNNLSSFPRSRLVKMRFAQEYQFDPLPGPAGIDENFIYANCIYMPDQSDATQRNALGYNQWGGFYERYVVVKSQIEVSYTAVQNLGTESPFICGIQVVDDQQPIAHLSQLIENRACSYRMLQSITNGNIVQKMKGFYKAKAWHGVTDVLDCDELEAEFVVADTTITPETLFAPRDKTYYRLFVQANDETINNGKVSCRAVVTYWVMCKDPKIIDQSESITTTTVAP